MKKAFTATIIIIVILGFTLTGLFSSRLLPAAPTQDPAPTSQAPIENENIKITSPLPNALIADSFDIAGEARGTWFFEASFPVFLFDANGEQVAWTTIHADSDWMTTDFVPFHTTLEFDDVETPTGVLVFKKDNPSGLPQNDAEVRVPVRFK